MDDRDYTPLLGSVIVQAPDEQCRVSARAYCSRCHWTADQRGDDYLEVARFLRAQLIEHARDLHPEVVATRIARVLHARAVSAGA